MDLQDSFYKRHTPEEIQLAHASRFDFDHPGWFTIPLIGPVTDFVCRCD